MGALILLFLGLSLLFAGFLTGIQAAFISVNKISIELKKKQGMKSAKMLAEFLEHPEKIMGSTIIGFTLMVVFYSTLISAFFTPAWGWVKNFFIESAAEYIEYIRLVFNILLATILLLFFRFTFRSIFRAKNVTLLLFFVSLAQVYVNTLQRFTDIFKGLSTWILKYLLNINVQDEKKAFARVDPEHFFLQNRDHQDENSDLNTELFEAALSLPTVKIRECLIPRKEVEAIDISTPINMVKEKFIKTKLSKLVVFDKNIDNILGYVHQRALFQNPENLTSILLPIPAVPESMNASDLISKFTRERKSIAWVVDEFGGTSGIITFEDLLEELFGDIQDEYDVDELLEKQLSEKEFLFSGRLELDYLNEKYDLNLPEEDAETLSGLIITKHESIPKAKERIIIEQFEFDILSVTETLIGTVRMKILQ
jgi:CBS domain containing-hemolysin-like protein